MSLRTRSLIALGVTFLVLFAILFAASRFFLLTSFAGLERDSTQRDLERILNDFDAEVSNLVATSIDWAAWDDTYQFVVDHNPEYLQSNLTDGAFLSLDLDLVLLYDSSGEMVFSRAFNSQGAPTPIPPTLLAQISPESILLDHPDAVTGASGLLETSGGTPLMVSARPIVTSDIQGPVRGTLIFGRYLNERRLQEWNQKLQLPFSVISSEDPRVPRNTLLGLDSDAEGDSMAIVPLDSQNIAGFAIQEDVYGQPAFVIMIEEHRLIYRQGIVTNWFLTGSILAAALISGLLLLAILERLVLKRIAWLSKSVAQIGGVRDPIARSTLRAELRLNDSGGDELSALASSINSTLESLEQSEADLETRLKLERLIASISASFVNLQNQDFEGQINQALQRVGEFAHIDHGTIILFSSDWPTISSTYEWCGPGIEPFSNDMPGTLMKGFPWWLAWLKRFEIIRIPSVIDLPTEAIPEKEFFLAQGIRSVIAAPFISGGSMIGLLTLDTTRSQRTWSDECVSMMKLITDILVNAIERQRSEEQRQRKADELAALHAVALEITAHRDLSTLLNTIVQKAAFLLGGTAGGMYLRDPEEEQVRCVVSYNTPMDYTGIVLKFGEGAAGKVAQTGQPLIVGNYETWEGRSPQYEKDHPFRSLVSVPMVWQGNVTGVIHVMYHSPDHEFTWHDVELLAKFANQAAIALENAKLYEQAQGQAREAETLRQAGAIVASSLDQDQAIEHILEQLERVVPYDSAAVQLLRDGHVEIVGGRGWLDNNQIIGLSFPIPGDNPNTVVIQTRRPYIIRDAPKAHKPFNEEPHSHIHSWLGVPLIIHDQVIGMLSIDKTQPDFFTPKHVELATAFADQVAISIENARLYSDVQERIGELGALRETVADITSELELSRLLKSILRRATRLLKATGGDLGLFEPESNTILVAVTHNMPRDYSGTRMTMGEGVMGQIALTKAPLIVEDYVNWEGRSPQFADSNWHAVVAAPLMIGKRLMGAIAVLDEDPARKFTESDQNLLMMLAQQASIAVENAHLYEEAQQQAITDPLTGLYNRRGLFELGQREVNRLRRHKRQLSAIMLDIDHFKLINDKFSHAIGDEVLRVLAERCRAHLRETDVLGRYGGEEFALILPETGVEESRQIAERLRSTISDVPIDTVKGPVEITISLGVTCTQDGTADLAVLLDRADSAMYEAKQLGRNRVEVG